MCWDGTGRMGRWRYDREIWVADYVGTGRAFRDWEAGLEHGWEYMACIQGNYI